jgi:predicted O-methyltransferase YrrM
MRSSYIKNNYGLIFEMLCLISRPKMIVEFGILDGYSLEKFALTSPSSEILAYDLFEDFPFNHANFEKIKKKFSIYSNVKIDKANFYEAHNFFNDNSIDILHIDIANDGATFEHALKYWTPKVKKFLLLEGGSIARDNVEWMDKYNKKKINPIIKKYQKEFKIDILNDYPSLTILSK